MPAALSSRPCLSTGELELGRPIWGFKEVRYTLSHGLSLVGTYPVLRLTCIVRYLRCRVDEASKTGSTIQPGPAGIPEGALRHPLGVADSFIDSNADPIVCSFVLRRARGLDRRHPAVERRDRRPLRNSTHNP